MTQPLRNVLLVVAGLAVNALLAVGIWWALAPRTGPESGPEDAFRYDLTAYARTDPAQVVCTEQPLLRVEADELHALAVAADDRVLVAADSDLIVLGPDGREQSRLKLSSPAHAVAVGPSGRVYLGMTDHVEVADSALKNTRAAPAIAGKPFVTSLAASPDTLYVADAGNRQVLQYDLRTGDDEDAPLAEGRNVLAAPDPFVVPSPFFDLALGPDGSLWVVNPGRQRLENYTPEGRYRRAWGQPGMGMETFCGCCNPTHIAVRRDGSFVTSEKGLARVKLYDRDGRFAGVVAGTESFMTGTTGLDLATDSRGRILVLDPASRIVRVFVEKKSPATGNQGHD